jgi:hypothetical protein
MRRACAAFDARLPCPALRRNPPQRRGAEDNGEKNRN